MTHLENVQFTRQIFDDVHGFIGITDLESKVIASPFFQRLRRIKQLSLLDYVFPGATHNRFSHSLGVMHIADNMVIQLQKDGYLDGKRKLVRMAALLHDVGHYPLSHLIEGVVKDDCKKRIKIGSHQIEEDDDNLSSDQKCVDDIKLRNKNEAHNLNYELYGQKKSPDYANHERMAGIVIHKTPLYDILSEDDAFSKEEIKEISQIIAGSYPSRGPEYLIIHSELDADRFDYLLRDSRHTGVTYGIFDMDRIIRNLKYVDTEGKLAVKEKARKAVDQYLMCRYFYYTTVINHKTTIGFEIIAKNVYEGLLEREICLSYFDLVDILNDKTRVNEYLDYDDAYFFNTLKNIYYNKLTLKPIENPKIPDMFLKELIGKLLTRDPLKMVFEESKLTYKNKRFDSRFLDSMFQDKVRLTNKIEDYWFIPFTKSEALTKISPHKNFGDDEYSSEIIDETIQIFNENNIGNKKSKTTVLITDETSIMSILGDYNLQINRLYTKNDEYEKILQKEYNRK